MATVIYGDGAFLRGTSTGITVPTGLTSYTYFPTWNTPDEYVGSGFNQSTGIYTPPIPGYCLAIGRVYLSSNGYAGTTYLGAFLLKNSTGELASSAVANVNASGEYNVIEVSAMTYMNGSTDSLRVGMKHNASGSLTFVVAGLQVCLLRGA